MNLSDVAPLFRNAHAVALHGRALSDYLWLCQLDVAKGLQLPMEYLTVKYAEMFLHHVARAERDRVSSDTGIFRFRVMDDLIAITKFLVYTKCLCVCQRYCHG